MPPRARLGRRRAGYAGTACPSCKTPFRHDTLKTGTRACPRCNIQFELVVFDPVEARVAVAEMAGLTVESAAPCATHSRNQAVAACEHCGKFMCELCKIDADRKVYCPGCFERLSAGGELASSVTHFKNYEGLALASILICWLFMPAALIAVPMGIYYCIRGLSEKARRDETEGRVALIVRLVILLLMSLGAVFVAFGIFGAFRS
jgi:uncharacterized paraquat-inducible protein A